MFFVMFQNTIVIISKVIFVACPFLRVQCRHIVRTTNLKIPIFCMFGLNRHKRTNELPWGAASRSLSCVYENRLVISQTQSGLDYSLRFHVILNFKPTGIPFDVHLVNEGNRVRTFFSFQLRFVVELLQNHPRNCNILKQCFLLSYTRNGIIFLNK